MTSDTIVRIAHAYSGPTGLILYLGLCHFALKPFGNILVLRPLTLVLKPADYVLGALTLFDIPSLPQLPVIRIPV